MLLDLWYDRCVFSLEEEKDLAQQMPPTLPSSSTTPPLATAADSPPAAPAKPMFRLHSYYLSEVLLSLFNFIFCITKYYLKLDDSTDTSSTRSRKKWWWQFSLKGYQSRTWMSSLVIRLWVSCHHMNALLWSEPGNLTFCTDYWGFFCSWVLWLMLLERKLITSSQDCLGR